VLNALADARWDLWRASRVLPDVDLLVSPCNIGLRGRARRHLLVVHDVMAIEHPELFDRRFSAYFRLLVPPSVRSADRVLTLSERAAVAIRRMDPGADVRVITWAHRGGDVTRATFPLRPIVLMVGATEPVKNQVAGVEAVARLRASTGADVGLRVIGPAGRAEAQVRSALDAADPAGSWAAREVDAPADILDRAYGSAWVLLQPSHDEGFGLPLVEAARHGLPVVHSGRGAMPSVLPEADVGGMQPDALAAAMAPLLDSGRWQCAADSIIERARAFDPETFRATLAAEIDDLLQGRS
jgi:glycosyltransferase involved in cell wall biosynthesis